jgi:hypothetical protein
MGKMINAYTNLGNFKGRYHLGVLWKNIKVDVIGIVYEGVN